MNIFVKAFTCSLSIILFCSCSNNNESGPYQSFRAAQKTYQTSVGPMAYTDKGEGSAIILIHGVPTSSWMYRKVIPGLAKKHRVIAVDLIGYGSSFKSEKDLNIYRPEEQARRVRALAKSLGLSQYSLVLHDMGGLVGWEMLRQDSSAISNLIVLNTIVRKEGFDPPNLKPGMFTEMLSDAFVNDVTSRAVLTTTLRSLGLTAEDSLSDAECYGYVEPLRESKGSDEAIYQFYTSLNPALYQRLEQNKTYMRKFKGDTLVLWGAEDKVLTTKQIPFLQENLRVKPENIHIYPKNDHFMPEEEPAEVVRRITSFLDQIGLLVFPAPSVGVRTIGLFDGCIKRP